MTILVLGATGQVGSHLQRRIPGALFWGRSDVDLSEAGTVIPLVHKVKPSAVINAAAYTAVDRAESEASTAWMVNAEGPAALAEATAALDIPLIHLSTDYVFDGQKAGPYREDDGPRPLGVYGRTKLAGELAVATLCERYWILRTSWVFSEFGSNFVKTMLRLSNERDQLRVVDDQRGRPNYAGDVADIIVALVKQLNADSHPDPGIYHTGGGPETTWYRFSLEILRSAQRMKLISKIPTMLAIPTSEYPTAAPRPLNSSLEPNAALQRQLGVTPDWQQGLAKTLHQLQAQRGVR